MGIEAYWFFGFVMSLMTLLQEIITIKFYDHGKMDKMRVMVREYRDYCKGITDEWLRYSLLLSAIAKIAPKRYRPYLSRRIQAASGSHPAAFMPNIEGKFNAILEIFEQIDPENYKRSGA